MRIARGPYTGATDNLLFGLLTGGDCLGFQVLQVNSNAAASLTIPDKAVYATIVIEADPQSQSKSKVIRVKEFDTAANPPTAVIGIPLSDMSVYEVKGPENLKNFKAIGIEAARVHTLTIHYYG